MRGAVAKKLRKEIYGKDGSSRLREYYRKVETVGRSKRIVGPIIRDKQRRAYKALKRNFIALDRATKTRAMRA
jgi:hypothetical protein